MYTQVKQARLTNVLAVSVIWSVLVLELAFEVIIRPGGYSKLIQSDRAFAPSTARHISSFHMFFEAIALLTYIPEFRCLVPHDVCYRDSIFSRVGSSLDAVLGQSPAECARGRFFLGLTALRLFGLIRHWKQMFINNTFRPVEPQGIEKWLIPTGKDQGDSIRSVRKRNSHKKNDVSNIRIWHHAHGHRPNLFFATGRKRKCCAVWR